MKQEEEKVPVYKYWMPCYSTEHFLLLNEIASSWNLYSVNGRRRKIHSQLVGAALKEYMKKNELPALYYETRFGLQAVYSKEMYEGAWRWFLEETNYAASGKIKIDNKNYSYVMIAPEQVEQ